MTRSISAPSIRRPRAILTFALVSFAALASSSWAQDTSTASTASSGITDDEIRSVVARVAQHQLRPLKEGEYPALTGPEDLAKATAALPPQGIQWSYPWGVTLYGLQHSVDLTGDQNVEDFAVQHNVICAHYYQWISQAKALFPNAPEVQALVNKNPVKDLVNLGSLDSCGAMGTEIVESMIRRPDQVSPAVKSVADRVADWVIHKQDRLPDGTLWRSKQLGGTIWPDDLYMGAVFLARWGKLTGQQQYIDDAAQQIIHQAALEQDTDGLWFHGYYVNEHQHAPYKWGRGNGWATVTLVETLSVLPESDPLQSKLLKILRDQAAGLKKVQAPSGLWRQLLDKPELWEETSCSAMFAYGLARAVNRGWLDASYMEVARKAFAGIAQNVTAEGVVKGTCQGTGISKELTYYAKRQRPDDDFHGRGVVLLAGTEILLAEKNAPK